jgi:hypothetical protein
VTWRLLVSGLAVGLWIRWLVTNVRGLPVARVLYVEHHPDLSRVEAERRIIRATVQAALLNSILILVMLWALWSW